MPGSSSQGIFLSYRREDTAPYARLLQFQFLERIPDAHVFMDLDSIEPGVDFAEVIRKAIDSCAVLVALIGRQWATIADEEGHRRLDNPDDFVCFEIQAALERGVLVIPVLVDGAKPLRQQQLPFELHKLARLNALELSYGRYQYDADRLIDRIQRNLTAASGTGTVHQSLPTANAETLAAPSDIGPDGSAFGEAAQKAPEPIRADRARAARILSEAVRVAQSITNEYEKAPALAEVAGALAATDPDRAARLRADAERIAQSIIDQRSKARALATIGAMLAATDPDRAARLRADAEHIVQSITNEYEKIRELTNIAKALAATDPDRAARLRTDAERIAQSITDGPLKARALAEVAGALAVTDPDRAERIAQSITDGPLKARALAEVAGALAVTDPDRAERIAQSITMELWKARALAEVAGTLAATDPDWAARLAADAERIAQSITDQGPKSSALAYTAKALAATNPDRAARLADDAERIVRSKSYKMWRPKFSMTFMAHEIEKSVGLDDIAWVLAGTDPDRAERIAQSITDGFWKAHALVGVAWVLAGTDPDRAERIAQSIPDGAQKARILVIIADKLVLCGCDAI